MYGWLAWLGIQVVRPSVLQLKYSGFNIRPLHCQVRTLGILSIHMCVSVTKQYNLELTIGR